MRAHVISRLLFSGLSALGSSSCSSSTSSCTRTTSTLSAMASPAPVVVPAKKEHKATVLFFHGLGDQGDGWADMFKSDIRHDNIKYICPSSASRPVTLNMGMSMPAWYDLYGLDASAREDDEGIAQATRLVHGMIDKEVASGIPSEKIVIGGFSMGGALALYAGLTYPHKLGGILGLSAFLLQRSKLPGSHTANLNTPIFLGHGSNDFLVPLTLGQLTEGLVKQFNPNIILKVYNGMGHSSCPQELQDVKAFINSKVISA